jgi:hypothetical protein
MSCSIPSVFQVRLRSPITFWIALSTAYVDDRSGLPTKGSWNPKQATEWLGLLAANFFHREGNITWWWMDQIVPPSFSNTIFTLAILTTAGIPAVVFGGPDVQGIYLLTGLVVMLLGVSIGQAQDPRTLTRPRLLWPGRDFFGHLTQNLAGLFCAMSALGYFIGLVVTRSWGQLDVAQLLVVSGVGYLLLSVKFTAPADLRRIPNSAMVRRLDLQASIVTGTFCAVGAGLCAPLWSIDLSSSIFWVAIVLILAGTALESAVGSWMTTWLWLAIQRKVPFRIFSFLEDARVRGVLRQAGTAYRFRHALLGDRLADTWISEHERRKNSILILRARSDLALAKFRAGNMVGTHAEAELRNILDAQLSKRRTYRDRDTARTWLNLALVLESMGEYDDAIREAKLLRDTISIKLDIEDHVSLAVTYVLGMIIALHGNRPEGLAILKPLLNLLVDNGREADGMAVDIRRQLNIAADAG